MSEETHQAPINIPRAMIWAVIINGVAAFAYIVTILYSITDVDTVLATPTGYPIIEVFLEATNNPRAATAMMCSVILIFSMALFGITASTGRLVWAFARDEYGTPFTALTFFLFHILSCSPNKKPFAKQSIRTGAFHSRSIFLISLRGTSAQHVQSYLPLSSPLFSHSLT